MMLELRDIQVLATFPYRMGVADVLSFLKYGGDFFKMRKLIQDQLTHSKCALFDEVQINQCCILLKNLLVSPEKFGSHTKR